MGLTLPIEFGPRAGEHHKRLTLLLGRGGQAVAFALQFKLYLIVRIFKLHKHRVRNINRRLSLVQTPMSLKHFNQITLTLLQYRYGPFFML